MKQMKILFLLMILSAFLVLSGCKEDFSPQKNLTRNASAQEPESAVSAAEPASSASEARPVRKEPEEMSNPKPEPKQEPETEPETEPEPYCGDGVCSGAENCDRCYEDCACESPAECHNGACKIPECGSDNDCEDEDACTKDECFFAQNVNAYCGHEPIKVCKNNDGCCAKGCNGNTDTDCESECGNDECEPGETSDNCYEDCGPVCGNQNCEFKEDYNSCPADCCEPDKWYPDGSSCNCPGGYNRVKDPGFYMCTK